MMYRYLTLDGPIVRLSDLVTIPLDPLNSDYQAVLAWCKEGNTIEPPLPPSPEELQATVTQAVQKRLDTFVATRGYDNVDSAAKYVTSKNPKYAAEGQYAVDACTDTWDCCYSILGAVQAGLRPLPTLEEVLAELPVLKWPL